MESNAGLPMDPARVAAGLALLSAEQNSLTAQRSLVYTESFSRVGTFMSALGAGTVTIGLIVNTRGFGPEVLAVAILLLSVVAFFGLASYLRLTQLNEQDIGLVLSLNRVRHGYRDLAPEFAQYLSLSPYDDERGLTDTLAVGVQELAVGGRGAIQALVTSPATVAIVNSVVIAVIGGCVLALAGVTELGPLGAVALAAFVVSFVLHARNQVRHWAGVRGRWRVRFPTPPDPT